MIKDLNDEDGRILEDIRSMAKSSVLGGYISLFYGIILLTLLYRIIVLSGAPNSIWDLIFLITMGFFTIILLILAFFPTKIKKIKIMNLFFRGFNETNALNYTIYSTTIVLLFFVIVFALAWLVKNI